MKSDNAAGGGQEEIAIGVSDTTAEEHRQAIEAIEAEDGPYAGALYEELLSLATLYQRRGEHDEAIAAFEWAAQVSRVNQGLYNLQQVPCIEGTIESLIAMGKLSDADEKYLYLVYLLKRHYGPDDPRTVPAFQALAEWSMAAFQRGVRYDFWSGEIGTALQAGVSSSKEGRALAFGMLAQSQAAYLKAIRTLVESHAWRDPRLPELERSLIETYFFQAHRENLIAKPNDYFSIRRTPTGSRIPRQRLATGNETHDRGEESYHRILTYLEDNPQTPSRDHAQTLIELGDWHLLFGRTSAAERKYREARKILEDAGAAPEEVEEILKPALPVALPVFTPAPHSREFFQSSRESPLEIQGYLDVSFTLNELGKARKIHITGKSPQATPAIERSLVSMLRNAQFRPRMEGDAPVKNDAVALRYYYGYAPSTPFSGEMPAITLAGE